MAGIQYSLSLHLREVEEFGINISLVDLCIFEFLKSFETKTYCQKEKLDDGNIYFWVSHDLIIDQLPILGIKSKRRIISHINKLVDVGLLSRYGKTQELGRSYYKFTELADKFDSGCTPSDENVTPPLTKTSHDNIQDIQVQEDKYISPNGGLSASAFDSKESNKEKSKPKSKPKKEPTLVTKAKNIFEPYFEKKTGEKYYWKAADGAQMKRLLSQLRFSRQNKGLSIEDEDLLSTLQIFLDKITDNWMLSNLSVSNISSKYNELVAQARKNKSSIGIILRDNTDEKYFNQKIKQWK